MWALIGPAGRLALHGSENGAEYAVVAVLPDRPDLPEPGRTQGIDVHV